MSLYEKIYAVMNESAGLEKNLQVGTGNSSYKAVSEAEVLNMMKPLFKKHKLIIFPVDGEVTEHNSSFETEYKGKVTTKTRNVTQLKVKFKIVDVETGESEILIGFGNGADSQDKGAGKAFTYAFKNVLSKTFMLFSVEDADNHHSDDIGITEVKKKDPDVKKISEPQAKRLFGLAKGNQNIVKTVITKYSYTSTKDISTHDYKGICEEIESEAKKLVNKGA